MLREAREAAGKSQGELARALGVSVTYVSDVERNTRAPFTPVRAWMAADFLGANAHDMADASVAYQTNSSAWAVAQVACGFAMAVGMGLRP
jgi:transcriptional regulator with XRE-family HTH domain